MAASEGVVQAGAEAMTADNVRCRARVPRIRRPTLAVAEDDRSRAARRRGHGMAVDQDGSAEPVGQKAQMIADGCVVGAMGLVETVPELRGRNRPPPQMTVPHVGYVRADVAAISGFSLGLTSILGGGAKL